MKRDHEIAGCDHLTGNKMKYVRVTSLMKYCIKIGPILKAFSAGSLRDIGYTGYILTSHDLDRPRRNC